MYFNGFSSLGFIPEVLKLSSEAAGAQKNLPGLLLEALPATMSTLGVKAFPFPPALPGKGAGLQHHWHCLLKNMEFLLKIRIFKFLIFFSLKKKKIKNRIG